MSSNFLISTKDWNVQAWKERMYNGTVYSKEIKMLCRHNVLPENVMREFKDDLKWRIISAYQVLTEDFMEEMEDYIDWNTISGCQNLSELFILKHKNKLNISKIIVFQEHLSRQFKKRFDNEFDRKKVML